MKENIYIGVHLDHYSYNNLKKVIEHVHSLKCNMLQIFVGDHHHTTLSKKNHYSKNDIIEIKNLLKKYKMKLVIHGLLSLNYCSNPHHPRFKWGLDNLIHDLGICKKMKCEGVVIHMGSFDTPSVKISYKDCLKNFVESLIIVLKKTKTSKIILETSVNRPKTIGGTIESLKELYTSIPLEYRKRIGFCIDTCHIFSAGYPINTIEGMKQYFEDFDRLIGKENIKLIHLNDSMREFDSHIDRHETIGKGYIFNKKLGGDEKVLNVITEFGKKNKIPIVLETNPKYFKDDLKRIKKYMKGGKKIKKKNNIKIIKKQNKKLNKKNINYKDKIINIFETILNFHQTLGKKGNIQTKYRISSYQKALISLKKVKKIKSMNDIKDIPYIGKGFQEKINEIIETGSLKMFDEIENDPQFKAIHLFEQIWGIGVEKARDIVLNNKIYTIEDLKEEVKKGKIELNEQQMKGLEYYEELKERIPRNEITNFTKYLQKIFKKYKIKIENAGSYRLGKKDSGDIDIIMSIPKYNQHTDYAKLEFVENIINDLYKKNILKYIFSKGMKKIICIIEDPITKKIRQMDMLFIDEKDLPWFLLYFGSNKEFSKKIRRDAIEKGYKLSESGIYNRKTGKKKNFEPKTERNIFNYLELEYVPPEKRIQSI